MGLAFVVHLTKVILPILDIVRMNSLKKGKGFSLQGPEVKNRIDGQGFQATLKVKPAALQRKRN
ncbi:MAG: hypothetical protein R6U51_01405 [Anaerolineales bacterium]